MNPRTGYQSSMDPEDGPRLVDLTLPGEPESVWIAQHRATQSLTSWRCPPLVTRAAQRLVGQMVAYAVTHGEGSIRVTLRSDGEAVHVLVQPETEPSPRRTRSAVVGSDGVVEVLAPEDHDPPPG
jgi:hypothetical protein